jgi:hypothetical protein
MWLVIGVCVAVVLVVVALVVVVVGRESEEHRRGGLLELDTWEARNALKLAGVAPVSPVAGKVSSLQRCRPERRLHYHGEGDRCECGQTSNVYAAPGLQVHPFAPRGDAA